MTISRKHILSCVALFSATSLVQAMDGNTSSMPYNDLDIITDQQDTSENPALNQMLTNKMRKDYKECPSPEFAQKSLLNDPTSDIEFEGKSYSIHKLNLSYDSYDLTNSAKISLKAIHSIKFVDKETNLIPDAFGGSPTQQRTKCKYEIIVEVQAPNPNPGIKTLDIELWNDAKING